jgi:anthranilate synthase
MIGFDGTLNTGLTLRTIRIKDGIAEVRAGATLLHDSDPASEEAETELKASALLDAIVRGSEDDKGPLTLPAGSNEEAKPVSQTGPTVLLVDHEDSFVHTLANYFRQAGADVVTCRSGNSFDNFIETQVDTGKFSPSLVVLSPGPGSPTDFKLSHTIDTMIKKKVPIFGVCLGLQGLVEHFGGDLDILDYPMHGKPSPIHREFSDDGDDSIPYDILRGLATDFTVARYHSLYGNRKTHPDDMRITACTAEGTIMAIQHKSMPIAAVQFHPESILTLPKNGMKIIENALKLSSTQYDSD